MTVYVRTGPGRYQAYTLEGGRDRCGSLSRRQASRTVTGPPPGSARLVQEALSRTGLSGFMPNETPVASRRPSCQTSSLASLARRRCAGRNARAAEPGPPRAARSG